MNNKLLQGKQQKVQDIIGKCYENLAVFAKTLFPHRFDIPFSKKLHGEIFKIMDDDSLQKVAIEAPRGIGKTTITNFLYPAKNLLFRERNYIVPISHSAEPAVEQSESLKKEIVSNETILKLFGDVSNSKKWSKKRWETKWDDGFRTKVLPRGAGQQVRGAVSESRPDLIVVDDLEDPEETRSNSQREKLRKWFFSDVMNSTQKYGPKKDDWRIIVVGSYLHEDSLITNLVKDSNWTSIKLSICDESFKSNWPEAISDDEIEDMYQQYEEQNITDVFHQEYMSEPTSSEDSTFQEDYFNYYSESSFNAMDLYNETFVIGDPAKTSNMNSAQSAIIGVTVNMKTHKIYVRRVIGDQFHPDEYIDALFDMCNELDAQLLAVEVTGLQEYISHPIRNQMVQESQPFEFMELEASRGTRRGEGKDNRIATLLPYYRQGIIYHNPDECGPLEMQLTRFPYSERKDLMDAFSYVTKILDEGNRYFSNTDSEDSEYDIEKEYEQLDYKDGLNQKDFAVI